LTDRMTVSLSGSTLLQGTRYIVGFYCVLSIDNNVALLTWLFH